MAKNGITKFGVSLAVAKAVQGLADDEYIASAPSGTSYGLHTQEQFDIANLAIATGSGVEYDTYIELKALADDALTKSHHAVEYLVYYQFHGDDTTPCQKAFTDEMNSYLSYDGGYVYALSLMYKFTGNEEYATKAIYFIDAWATINKGFIGARCPNNSVTINSTCDGYTGTAETRCPDSYLWDDYGYYDQTQADLSLLSTAPFLVQGAILLKDHASFTSGIKTLFNTWLDDVYMQSLESYFLNPSNNEWIGGNVEVTVRLAVCFYHAWIGYTDTLRDEDVAHFKEMMDKQSRTMKNDPTHKYLKHIPVSGDYAYNIPHTLPVEHRRGSKGMWYTAWTISSFSAGMEIILNETGVDLFRYRSIQSTGEPGSTIYDLTETFFAHKVNISGYTVPNPSGWAYWDDDAIFEGTANPPPTDGWGGKLFCAMGYKYNKSEWISWANSTIMLLPTTQLNWCLPTLLKPKSFN